VTGDDSSESRGPEPSVGAYPGHGATVLVVEDEPRLRKMTVARLRDLGYRVLDAANGPDALAVIESGPPPDLLFTDMVMPGGMTGADLATAAREKQPEIKVLFTSGYSEPDVVRRGQTAGAKWLRKPYSVVDLARTLRDILDEAPST
jgi:CheY-like chemotaxis protein